MMTNATTFVTLTTVTPVAAVPAGVIVETAATQKKPVPRVQT